jgi:putative transcription factor
MNHKTISTTNNKTIMNNSDNISHLDHQDWKTLIIHNKKNNKGNNNNNNNKIDSNTQKLISIEKKADNDNLKHDKIPNDLRIKIQQGRSSRGLTQKQLANQINIPLQKISEIENGKAIYNAKDINKIKRFLKL